MPVIFEEITGTVERETPRPPETSAPAAPERVAMDLEKLRPTLRWLDRRRGRLHAD